MNKDGRLMRSGGARKDLLSMANMEFQAKRIKFSLKKSSRDRLFGQLQEANERMRNLLESSDHITAARRSREATKPTSIMNRKINEFWQHAKRLHEALSKAWQCGCGSHVANLQLQHRTSDKVEFDVLFNVGATTGHNHWRETKIKMLPGIFTTPLGGVSISTGQQATPTTTRSPRQVRWTAPSSQPPPKASNEQMVKIHDLCSALSTHYPDCFGFLDEDEHRFAFYPGSQTVSISNISTITLDRLLEDTYALSRRKRYFLALTLASSYLQLGSTPWLSAPLRNDSIVFLQDPSDPSSIILDQPYIRREISKHPCTPTPDTISILGIRLLELCFGATLENNRFRKQLPTGDAVSGPVLDYAAAIQWSKLVSEEAGPEFAEAIDWCLHAKELNDGSWRKEIWTHVIIPLDSCHKQVSQKPLLR